MWYQHSCSNVRLQSERLVPIASRERIHSGPTITNIEEMSNTVSYA